jgi:hypothetical protein
MINDPNATRQFERQAQSDLERIEALELAIQLLDKASA